MKTRIYLLVFVSFIVHLSAKSQVKVGDNPTTINSASLLELETTNKGLVLPRVSITNVSSSAPLSAGLLTGTIVYNTSSSTAGGSGAGIYYWDGSQWNFIANTTTTASYWSLNGNNGTNASSNFLGTTDAVDFVTRTNNTERMRVLGANTGGSKAGWIGMGISAPRSLLDVTGDYTNKNVLTLQNTSSTGYTSVDMLDNTGALKGTFGYANTAVGGSFGGRTYFNSYGSDLLFTANSGNYHLFLQGGTGYIGVNTNTPSQRLHVVGNFYLSGAFMPGGDAGTSGYILTSAGTNAAPTWNRITSTAWGLTGNTGTSYVTNFLGTSDNVSMRFRTNNVQRMIIDSLGRVGIGLNNPGYALSVLSASNPLYLSGLQATSTFTADSLLTINGGVVKKAPYSAITGATTNALTISGNTLTSTVNGIAATSNTVTGVSNASSVNNLSTTVNGVAGNAVSIINTNANALSQSGGLVNTVNGVIATTAIPTGTVNNILGYNASGSPVYQTASGILSGSTTNALDLNGNILTSTVNGITDTSKAVSVVSNTSSANTLATTVNGIAGTTVPIINTNTNTLSPAALTNTVNGVSATTSIGTGTAGKLLGFDASNNPITQTAASLINSNTTNVLDLNGNILTSTVNGVTDTSKAVSVVSNTSSANTLATTVNGIAGTTVPIINTNANALTPAALTNTVNGVSATTSIGTGTAGKLLGFDASNNPITQTAASLINSNTTNVLDLNGNILTSTVNGVTDTSKAVSAVSNTSSVNTLATTVNGVAGATVPIINTNSNALTPAALTNTVNGVPATTSIGTGTASKLLGFDASNNPVTQTAASLVNSNTTNTLDLNGNVLTSTVNGVTDTSKAVSVVSNTSTANTLATTVNGVAGATVPIINSNSNALSQSGGLVTTVNGVAANTSIPSGAVSNILGYNASGAPVYQAASGILSGSTTNALDLNGNILTSTVNGVTDTSKAVSVVSNTSSANTLATTVNGVVGTTVPIINTNTNALTPTALTNTVNGVSATTSINTGTATKLLGFDASNNPITQTAASLVTANTTNVIGLSGNVLTSTVNGITDTSKTVSGVSNTSSANTITTTVNGITGTTAPIINSNTKTWTQSGGITTTVNGVSSNVTPTNGTIANILGYSASGAPVYQTASGILSGSTTNVLDLNGNILTSTVNGVIDTSKAVSSVSNTSNVNSLSTTINGVAGTTVPIINTNTNALTQANGLVTNVNGVADTTAIASGTVNNMLGFDNTGVPVYQPLSSISTNSWRLTGNGGTNYSTNFLGTTDNVSMRFRTNNIQRMILDSLGGLGIGSEAFDPVNRERLLVDYGTTTSHTLATFRGKIADYLQVNIQNTSNSSSASTDYVATSDDGTDSTYYVDMGINSSTYAPSVDNWGAQHDAYLYANARNLVIGTQSSNSDLIFLVSGGKISTNTAIRILGADRTVVFGRGELTNAALGTTLRGPNGNPAAGGTLNITGGNGSGAFAGGSLNLSGGNSLVSGVGGNVNISGGTSSTGTYGQITFSTTSTERMRIDQSGNVGIGITSPAYKLHVVSSTSNSPLYLGGVPATTAFSTDSILTIYNGVVKKAPYSSLPSGSSGGSGWLLSGNSGTSSSSNFLGTTDAQPLVIKSLSRQLAYFDGNLYNVALGFGAVNNVSDHNIAIGYNASTNNQYTLALGYGATASGVRSVAIGNGNSPTASGAESIAVGFGTVAGGVQSTAIGYSASATGSYGIALGYGASANTNADVISIGRSSVANAQSAVAIGYNSQATGLQSTAIGYNAQTSQSNTILLGNAAQTNLFVGIGTSTPTAKLHIVGGTTTNYPLQLVGLPTGTSGTDNIMTVNSSGVVGYITPSTFNGTYWSLSGNAAVSGSFLGTTNAQALQFKYNNTNAGYLDANNTSFGTSAISTSGTTNTAIGYSSTAANGSTAVGASSNAANANNTAIGNSAVANGSTLETAIGSGANVNSQEGTALGNNAVVQSGQGTSLGASSKVTAQYGVAVGYKSTSGSGQAIAVGYNSTANGQYSSLIGSASTAGGQYSSVVGTGTTASGQYSTALGSGAQSTAQYNTTVGYNALANNSNQATAIGASSQATYQYSTSLGYNAQAITANQTTAIGSNTLANATSATALGYGAKAQASNSTAIGYNASTTQANALILGDATNTSLYTGIGTATPTQKLDIVGNLKFSGALMPNNDAGDVGEFLVSTGTNSAPVWFDASTYAWQLDGNSLASIKKFGTINNLDIPFITNNTERMRLTTGGFLGIGTTSPQQALSVVGGAVIDQNNTNSGSLTNGLTFGNNSGEGIASKRTAAGNQFGLDFYTNYTNKMAITSGGNVGINTTSPNNKLEITQGTAGNSGLRFTNLTSATTPVTNPTTTNPGVLSVNSSGDVILVKDGGSSLATSANSSGSNCTSCNNINYTLAPATSSITVNVGDVVVIEANLMIYATGGTNTASGSGGDFVTIKPITSGTAGVTWSAGTTPKSVVDYASSTNRGPFTAGGTGTTNAYPGVSPTNYIEYGTVTSAGTLSGYLQGNIISDDSWVWNNSVLIIRKN